MLQHLSYQVPTKKAVVWARDLKLTGMMISNNVVFPPIGCTIETQLCTGHQERLLTPQGNALVNIKRRNK